MTTWFFFYNYITFISISNLTFECKIKHNYVKPDRSSMPIAIKS